MFTLTLSDFFGLRPTTTLEEFMGKLGGSQYVVPQGEPRTSRYVMFQTFYNIYIMTFSRGLYHDHFTMPEIERYVVRELEDLNLVTLFQQELREVFYEGVRDRVNLRYLVSLDTDYANWEPKGLFMSLESANKCGTKLEKDGTFRDNLKVDVLLQRP